MHNLIGWVLGGMGACVLIIIFYRTYLQSQGDLEAPADSWDVDLTRAIMILGHVPVAEVDLAERIRKCHDLVDRCEKPQWGKIGILAHNIHASARRIQQAKQSAMAYNSREIEVLISRLERLVSRNEVR